MARLVSRRSLLPQILVLAFLALSLAAPLGAASAGVYTQSAVRRAFQSVNIKLNRKIAGNNTQPVTALTAVVPENVTHAKAWAVQVFVYRDVGIATRAYKSGAAGWRDNGLASARLDNVVFTVVPKGQPIGSHGPPFAMPPLVRN